MEIREVATAGVSIIITSVFWLFVLLVSHTSLDYNAYREGYAEGKAGLPERYETIDKTTK